MSGFSVKVRLWTTPKQDAESGKENEDRFWLSGCRPGEPSGPALIAAIADGASGSLFSREWARHLVRVYCESGAPQPFPKNAFWEEAIQGWEK
ncbi:MAG: hypothetical protein V4671_17075, partial [Armatimonadota bacterium]